MKQNHSRVHFWSVYRTEARKDATLTDYMRNHVKWKWMNRTYTQVSLREQLQMTAFYGQVEYSVIFGSSLPVGLLSALATSTVPGRRLLGCILPTVSGTTSFWLPGPSLLTMHRRIPRMAFPSGLSHTLRRLQLGLEN